MKIIVPDALKPFAEELIKGAQLDPDDVTAVDLTFDPAKATRATADGYHSEITFHGRIEYLDDDPLVALAFTENAD